MDKADHHKSSENSDFVSIMKWKKTWFPEYKMNDKSRVILAFTDQKEYMELLSSGLRPYHFIYVEPQELYHFDSYQGIKMENNIFHVKRLFHDLENRRMIPDTIFVQYTGEEETQKIIRLLSHTLKDYRQKTISSIVIIAPEDLIHKNRLISLVQAVCLEHQNVDIRLLYWDPSYTYDQVGELLKIEMNCRDSIDVMVRYKKHGRYAYLAVPLNFDTAIKNKKIESAFYITEMESGGKVKALSPNQVSELLSLQYVIEERADFDKIDHWNWICEMEAKLSCQFEFLDLSKEHELLEELCTSLVYSYLAQQFRLPEGMVFTKEQLKQQLNAEKPYERYVDIFIDLFLRQGIIEAENNSSYLVTDKCRRIKNSEQLIKELEELNKSFGSQSKLVKYCVEHYPAVFHGKESGIAVLYPESNNTLLRDSYTGSFEEKDNNYIIQYFLEILAKLCGDSKKIRILEVGGGYGLLTRELVKLIKTNAVEYYFSDVSNKYLDDINSFALEHEIENISFGLFDITNPPIDQGVQQCFDLIIGYNVVHAMFNIEKSLRNLKEFLKVDGCLCVLERTSKRTYSDLIWGLAKDWLDFDETERKLTPLMKIDEWEHIFKNAEYDSVVSYPQDENVRLHMDMGIIIGQASSVKDIREATQIKAASYDELEEKIADRLKQFPYCKTVLIESKPPLDLEGFRRIGTGEGNRSKDQLAKRLSLRFKDYSIVELVLIPEQEWSSQKTDWFVETCDQNQASAKCSKIFYGDQADLNEWNLGVLESLSRSHIKSAMIQSTQHKLFQLNRRNSNSDRMIKEVSAEINMIEQIVIGIWKDLFGYNEIQLHSNFFELGGDSFKEIQFIADLKEKGYSIVPKEVFKNQTVREIAKRILELNTGSIMDIQTVSQIKEYLENNLSISSQIMELENGGYLLLVNDLEDKGKVLEALKSLKIDSNLLPTYILPRQMLAHHNDAVSIESLISSGVLKEYDEEMLEEILETWVNQEEAFNQSVLAKPIVNRNRLNNIHKLHFNGTTELQLYLINFEEMIDIKIMEEALIDVITKYETLRSYIGRDENGEDIWLEAAAPDTISLPFLDFTGLTKDFCDKVMQKMNDMQWEVDFKNRIAPMFKVVLIKNNEKSYTLFFQFDHSIFDLSSGQAMRASLLKRYYSLKKGEKKSIDFSFNYRDYLKQIGKGPLNTTPKEIIDYFDGEKYRLGQVEIAERIKPLTTKRLKHTYLHIDLEPFLEITKVQDVAFELTITLLAMLEKMRQLIAYVNKHNISFANMVWDDQSEAKWGEVLRAFGKDADTINSLRTPCLVNYAGRVESEYTKVWEYSLTQLDKENQEKLDYGEFYTLSKITGNTLEFLMLFKVECEIDEVNQFIEEQRTRLLALYKNKQM